MKVVTQKQLALLKAIGAAKRVGKNPSLKDLATAMGLTGPSSIEKQIRSLEKKGCLTIRQFGSGRLREYELTTEGRRLTDRNQAPLLGSIPAGEPQAVFDPTGEPFDPMDDLNIGPDDYWITASGDSMTGAGILDGDHVLMRRVSALRVTDGAIYAVILDGGDVTLKHLRHEPEEKAVRLIPANPSYPEKVVAENTVQVQGVLRAVFRKVAHR